jgi:integrase
MISEKFNEPDELVKNFLKTNLIADERVLIKRIKFALSKKQRAELLETSQMLNYKHYLMIRTQLELGLRVNELCNLIIPDINFNEGYVFIRSRPGDKYTKAFHTKTLCSNRQIPIPSDLLKELRSFIGNSKIGYVFTSQKKGPFLKNTVIGFINLYAKMCDSINCTIGSHALRRTYASYLIQNNIPVTEISKLLGHNSIRTTMDYLFEINSVNFGEIKKIVNKMNRIN